MVRVDAFWHKDQKGNSRPDQLRGKVFLHNVTKHLYVVVGAFFNTTTDEWAIAYERYFEDERAEFQYTRDMSEFLDGRFTEVK